ncbi:MAG: hypothetical protein WC423_24950, partial [Vulcanimicrobiota bacterium]
MITRSAMRVTEQGWSQSSPLLLKTFNQLASLPEIERARQGNAAATPLEQSRLKRQALQIQDRFVDTLKLAGSTQRGKRAELGVEGTQKAPWPALKFLKITESNR